MAARREKFERTRPDGTVVVIDRNIDTGEQKVTEKATKSGDSKGSTETKSPATKSGDSSK